MRERRPTGAVSAMTQIVVRYDLSVKATEGLGNPRDHYRRFCSLMSTGGGGDSYGVFPAVKEGREERRHGLPVSILVVGDAGSGFSVDMEARQREVGLVGGWQGSADPVVLYAEVPVGSMPTHEYRMRA